MAVAALLSALLAGCGESSADSNEREGTYEVAVTGASFPTKQVLGQTLLLKLSVKNEGEHALPSLVVSFTIAGKEGEESGVAFAVRDPQKGLASADRPVWVLAQGYPQLAGAGTAGGAATSNSKTYSFGPLKPGETTSAVWKLSAVREGKFTIHYTVGAGLGEGVHAKTSNGVAPGGTFVADVSAEVPNTEVNDAGEIVEIPEGGSGEGGK